MEDPLREAHALDPGTEDVALLEKAASLYRVSMQRDGETFAALWQGARSLCALAQLAGDDAGRQRDLAAEARGYAEKATHSQPSRVEGHYYLAIATGLFAEAQAIRAISGLPLVDDIEAAGKAAVRIDPAFDRAGPHLLLGELYFQAPGFPTSIGDIDLALWHLRKAVDLAPDHAPNRIALAEVILDDDDGEDPEDDARKVFAPIADGQAAVPSRWRERYAELRARLGGS